MESLLIIMKRICKSIILLILSLSFVSINAFAQQEKNEQIHSQEETLYKSIDNFIDSIPRNTDSLIVAVNYAIAFSNDLIVKSHIAGYLFNKFSTSGVMGDETIAVYISKNYFLNELLPWYGQGGIALLKLYTEFNESSLIGMKAPELNLNTTDGRYLPLTSLKKRYTVIYFFDNNCTACKEGLPGLKEIIKTYSHLSLDVYAVFSQSDSSSLNEFKKNNFSSQEQINWHFVYDPLAESNFHKLYNVLITPRIFLLDRNKKIIGRNLSNDSLKELLIQEQRAISESYTLAENFIAQYLSIFDFKDSTERKEAFEPLFNRLSSENPDMYNAVFYLLFENLCGQEEQYMKATAVFLANNYILPYRGLWFNDWFINTRIPATIAIIESNAPGAKLPTPTLFTSPNLLFPKGHKTKLNPQKSKYTYLYFFNPDCSVCKPFSFELKKIFKDLKQQGVTVIAIYTGTDVTTLRKYIKEESAPWKILYPGISPQTPLHEIFETEFTPQTYLLDRDGIIIAKSINTIQLLKLIK